MTTEGWITLATIAAAALLLVTERLRPDLTALLVLLTLNLTGVLTPEEAFSGFSQAAVITILSTFILTAGLEQSGVTRWIGQRILHWAGSQERRLVASLTLTSAGLSTFMNSIAAAAVLVPTSVSIARQSQLRPSRLLMTLSYGAMLGGTATLLTTANIVVSTALANAGYRPYGLLDFLPVGIPLVLGGAALLVWLAPHVLPDRDVGGDLRRTRRMEGELARLYQLSQNATEVLLRPGSTLAGLTLGESAIGRDLGLTALGVFRQGRMRLAPDRHTVLEEGDILIVEGRPTDEQLERYGLRAMAQPRLSSSRLVSENVPLVEVILAPRSELEGKTLRQVHFRERYGLQGLAVWRHGEILQEGVSDLVLRLGDALLLQGPREKVDLLQMDAQLIILEEETRVRPGLRAYLTSGIMLATLLLAGLQILPVATATLTGATLMILTGCLSMDDAYRAVSWKAVFMVAFMLPVSIALQTSGTADVLARLLVDAAGNLGSLGMSAVLLLLTIGTALLLGGQTTAVVIAPIAIAVAGALQVDARAMAMAVALGCSFGFSTPLGHSANLLVMGPGGYRTRDYLRLGVPLTLLAILITLAGLHWIWGL
jgi:di/tricarboxylate transporter